MKNWIKAFLTVVGGLFVFLVVVFLLLDPEHTLAKLISAYLGPLLRPFIWYLEILAQCLTVLIALVLLFTWTASVKNWYDEKDAQDKHINDMAQKEVDNMKKAVETRIKEYKDWLDNRKSKEKK